MGSVQITDANGCDTTINFTITEPTELQAALSLTDVDCNGADNGSASVSASGGVTPYTYLWSTGATGNSVSGLSPGNYNVQVTDANGCDTTINFSITEPTALEVTLSSSDVSCYEAADGWASVDVLGGTSPYSYNWSTGASTDSIGGLLPGTYSVSIRDAGNCDTVINFTIT